MPTYPYACTTCDHTFEKVQSFSEDSLTVCPECGGRLRKVFGSVGVVFKGSGFYRNDSRVGAGAKSSSKDGTKDSGSGGDSSSTKVKEPATASTSGDKAASSSKGSGSSSSSTSSSSTASGSKGASSAA